jgi:hypothetical protein
MGLLALCRSFCDLPQLAKPVQPRPVSGNFSAPAHNRTMRQKLPPNGSNHSHRNDCATVLHSPRIKTSLSEWNRNGRRKNRLSATELHFFSRKFA